MNPSRTINGNLELGQRIVAARLALASPRHRCRRHRRLPRQVVVAGVYAPGRVGGSVGFYIGAPLRL
jgi:hypothetical protein